MSQISAAFIIETLETIQDEMIANGDRFRPLTLDLERCIQRLNEIDSLKELEDDDDDY